MTPYSVFEQPVLSGFIRKSEQTGFRMQKPEAVIEPLLRMTTKPGDLVVDPTCGQRDDRGGRSPAWVFNDPV